MKTTQKERNPLKVRKTFYLDAALVEEMEEAARRDDRSVSKFLTRAIRSALAGQA